MVSIATQDRDIDNMAETKGDIADAVVEAKPSAMGSEYLYAVVVRVVWNHFLKSRNLTPIARKPGDVATEPSKDRIISDMETRGVIRIDAEYEKEAKNNHVIIFILSEKSKYAHQSAQLKTLLASVHSDAGARGAAVDEVILITSLDFFHKRNLLTILDKATEEGKARYHAYPYHLFVTDIWKRTDIPRHEIMTDEAFAEFLKSERLTTKDVQPIYRTDTPIVWLGATPGKGIRVIRDSETAMKSINVRIVVEPTTLPFIAQTNA